MRYFRLTCLPNLACDATPKTDRSPNSPDLMTKITAIENKVDYLLFTFNDASPFAVIPGITIAEKQTASIKPV